MREPPTFTSSRSTRALLLSLGVVAACLGLSLLAALCSGRKLTAISSLAEFACYAPLGVLSVAGTGYFWRLYRKSLVRYSVVDDTLAIETDVERTHIHLAGLRTYQIDRSGTIVLTDEHGTDHEVVTSLIHDPGRHFRTMLLDRLEPLRERRLAELDTNAGTFQPWRLETLALYITASLFLWMVLIGLLDNSHDDAVQRIAISLIFVAFSAVSVLAARFTQQGRILAGPAGIVLQTRLYSRAFPWALVTRLANKVLIANHRTVRHTILVSPTGQISFSERMADYDLLRLYAERKVAAAAQASGVEWLAEEERKKSRLRPYAFAVVIIYVAAGYGLTRYFASTRMAEQDLLDREGVPGLARVEGKERAGDARAPYRIRYSFFLDGRLHRRASRTDEATFGRAVPGATIPIVYLPDAPDSSRLKVSLDREAVRRLVVLSNLLLPQLLALPALLAYSQWRRRRTVAAGRKSHLEFEGKDGQ